jgi:EPS-associated MarR family transcriptional regulator
MSEDRSILSILETLAASADAPQRFIAAQTGLNLAKVNFVMRRLIDKGFVKLKRVRDNPHKWRYLYLLTPEGISEKSRLTYTFLQRSLKEYHEAERRVKASIEEMLAQGVRKIVLYGNNEITDLCLRLLEQMSDGKRISVLGVVDEMERHPLSISPSQVVGLGVDAVVVCDAEVSKLPRGIQVRRLV